MKNLECKYTNKYENVKNRSFIVELLSVELLQRRTAVRLY